MKGDLVKKAYRGQGVISKRSWVQIFESQRKLRRDGESEVAVWIVNK